MIKLRPSWLPPATCSQVLPPVCPEPGFIVHPSTSELASQLMIDPESLSNENYSGLYDENGDYIPQYCDNPDDIPQGMIQANESTGSAPAPLAERGADKSNDSPAETLAD